MTSGELAKVTTTCATGIILEWLCQGHCNSPCGSSGQTRVKEGVKCLLSSRCDPVEVQKFSLNDVKGPVHNTQKVTILPFCTVNVQASTSVKGHSMQVHASPAELMQGPQLPAAVVPTASYGELHPGSSRVPNCLHNLSACAIEIPTKAMVGQVVPANQVPLVVHPTRTTEEMHNTASKGWVLEASDLQGLKE